VGVGVGVGVEVVITSCWIPPGEFAGTGEFEGTSNRNSLPAALEILKRAPPIEKNPLRPV
jgi:hypothetical protein